MNHNNLEESKAKNYKYVIAGGPGFYSVAYFDVKRLSNVKYFSSYIGGVNNKLMRLLTRLTFNIRYGSLVRWLLKPLVYRKVFRSGFSKEDDIVFLFFESQYAVINTDYTTYLRKHYPKSKLVLFMQDVVSSLPYYDIKDYKKRFDIVLSYDQHDCDRYGLLYHPTPYSRFDSSRLQKTESLDVFFCGSAKTRLKTIMEVYHICKENGLKVKFYINGVPDELQEAQSDIIYNTPISYKQNLAYVVNSKCILEVMQERADGFTPRLWEAIIYNKHLITNNEYVKSSQYYIPAFIHHIEEGLTPKDWIDNIVDYPTELAQSKSPIQLLAFITSHLC